MDNKLYTHKLGHLQCGFKKFGAPDRTKGCGELILFTWKDNKEKYHLPEDANDVRNAVLNALDEQNYSCPKCGKHYFGFSPNWHEVFNGVASNDDEINKESTVKKNKVFNQTEKVMAIIKETFPYHLYQTRAEIQSEIDPSYSHHTVTHTICPKCKTKNKPLDHGESIYCVGCCGANLTLHGNALEVFIDDNIKVVKRLNITPGFCSSGPFDSSTAGDYNKRTKNYDWLK